MEADITFEILQGGMIDALCGFFDVSFKGSPENPTQHEVLLSTAPEIGPCTHWGQLSFFMIPQLPCQSGHSVPVHLQMTRRKDNHRLMNMKVAFKDSQDASNAKHYDFIIE